MKGNRVLSVVLVVVMLVSAMPMLTFADSTSGTEGYLSYEIVDGEVTITDCDESVTGEVVIPEAIQGLPVTRIGEMAFESCYYMSGITIPKTIKSIGGAAFDNCYGSLVAVHISDMSAWCRMVFEDGWGTTNPLSCVNAYLYLNGEKVTDVVIPEGVSSINEHVFEYYRGMESISIPKSVTSIGWSAFNGCENLKEVYISDMLAWYDIDFINENSNPMCNGADLYLEGEKIKDLVIPVNVTSIKDYTFEGCTSLERVSVHKNVTGINYAAFRDCTNLKSVYIDDLSAWCGIDFGVWGANPLENGADLYLNGEKITELVISSQITNIREYAFAGCQSITSVRFPSSVSSVGVSAFNGCSNLKKVYAEDLLSWCNMEFRQDGSNPLSNGADLYLNGEKVTKLVIPSGVTTIKSGVFQGYKGLTNIIISEGVESINFNAFEGCTGLASIEIPDSVTSIGEYAFKGCMSLAEVRIPDGVTCVERSTFQGCTSLERISIPESIESIEDYAFSECENLSVINIPDSVKSIGAGVFNNCKSLKSVDLPSHITDIGYRMFYGCESLATMNIPDNVTGIGIEAFYGCKNLTSINIPENVKYVWQGAFGACENLGKVYITDLLAWFTAEIDYEGPLSNGADLYLNDEKVTELVVPEEISDIREECFRGCRSITKVVMQGNVISIGWCAFADCTNLIDISIPESVENIEQGAFFGCTSLVHIDIPTKVKSIKGATFENCINLTSVSIPYGVTSIGQAFCGCTSLVNIKLPESITSINNGAFGGCTSLEEINIPGGVKSIGSYLFEGCTNLRSVSIAEGVTGIEDSVFMDCTSIEEIKLPKSITYIDPCAFSAFFNDVYSLETIYYSGSVTEWNAIDKRYVFPDDIQIIYNYIGLSSNDVKLDATRTEIDSDFELVVEAIEDASEIREIITNSNGSFKINDCALYDISLMKNNQKVQPNGNVTVSIRVPDGVSGESCKVFYIDDAGNVTDMNAVYENGYLVFKTDHFSYYAIVELNGTSVGGIVTSFGAEGENVTVRLLQNATEIAKVETTDESYAFSNISSGTYTLEISKANHMTRTYEITVGMAEIVQNVKICLLGDVTGDGQVKIGDYAKILAYVRGTSDLSDYELQCADVTGDGKVKIGDYAKVLAHVRGTTALW